MSRPVCWEECAEFLRSQAKELGLDVVVSTAKPLVPGPYTQPPFICPHEVTFWLEPTGEQIAQWTGGGTR
jgi:hypothetical protein